MVLTLVKVQPNSGTTEAESPPPKPSAIFMIPQFPAEAWSRSLSHSEMGHALPATGLGVTLVGFPRSDDDWRVAVPPKDCPDGAHLNPRSGSLSQRVRSSMT